MKKKLIGYAGVDSGQLMVCDPCYMGMWEDREFLDIRRLRDKNGKIYTYRKDFDNYESVLFDNRTVNELVKAGQLSEVDEPEDHSFSYPGCCRTTNSDDKGGQLNFPIGHEGVGVVFQSGYGDGHYPVYAHYNKEGRIIRVTIEMG